ncbi:G8 domain-containing protein [Allorhodopirellula heiligendammensis]|uniref:G8 domain protein n=1 Tax=Allorhodopirellula heiligendammensis TaxID=2714739 RepID=A0A5C6CB02_9BACT|nr:G8 domain-containing protein [Allorhodopirellula heiligendammensis]TWU19989.1 G8 domain protein [Allorhodopirellula heiligendammensis]
MNLRIPRSNRRLRLESLESRRLLANDLAVPDFGTLAMPSFSPAIVSATSTSEMVEGEMTMQSMDMGHSMFEITPDAVVTMHDNIPRFGANPTFISIRDGNWSDPSIWQGGQVPGANAIVSIPAGRLVTYDIDSTMRLDAIEVSGELKFATDSHTSVWLNELMVMPAGTLTIGTAVAPVNASVTAEVVFTDTPQADGHHFKTGTVEHPGIDPSQWGNGLIVLGKAEMHGHTLQNTFVRAAGDVLAGSTTIEAQGYVGDWQVGDRIVIPDTRQTNPVDTPNYYTYESQEETATIVAVTANSIVVDHPLQFDHVGPRDADGTPTQTTAGVTLAPHIANFGRNVVLRSENPDGVRGHVAFVGDASKDIRYVAYQDLGRTDVGPIDNTTYDVNGQVTHIGTNQIARYSDHNHHLSGPMGGIPLDAAHADTSIRYQSIGIGNSIDGALKWGTTIHASHFGLTADSVYHDVKGAAVATEDGSEYGNTISGNFVVGVHDGETGFNGLGENLSDRGDQGDGFWFAGPMNSVTDNVVANAVRNGFVVFPDNIPNTRNSSKYREVRVPLFAGANMHDESQTRLINVLAEPFDDFSGNEIYGATTAAVQLWSVGNRSLYPDAAGRNTLIDTTVWHVTGVGIRFYYADDYVVDGWLQRGDPAMISARASLGGPSNPAVGAAIIHAGSRAATSIVRHAEVQNMTIGYFNRGRGSADDILLEDSHFDNDQNILVIPWGQNPADGVRDFLMSNVTFGNSLRPGSQNDITLRWTPAYLDNAVLPESTVFRDFDGVDGLDLSIYYPEQAPDTIPEFQGEPISPGGNLTNAESFAQYGVAANGFVAPSREIDGDNGETALTRGRAMGIDGLVFEQNPLEQPLLFMNVRVEFSKPVLYYTVVGNPAGVTGVEVNVDGQTLNLNKLTGKAELSFLPNLGDFEIQGQIITTTGSGASSELQLQLPFPIFGVVPPNNRPVLQPVAAQALVANSVFRLDLAATDADGDIVEYSSDNLPTGATLNKDTGEFVWQPSNDQSGSRTINFFATDSRNGQASMRVRFDVVFDASPSPLVGNWEFNTGSTNVSDGSTYAFEATMIGTPKASPNYLEFQGRWSGQRLEIEPTAAHRPTTAITLRAVVQPTTRNNSFEPLIRYESGSVEAYSLTVKDGGSMSDERGSLQGYWFTVRTEAGTQRVSARITDWDIRGFDEVVGVFDGSRDGGRLDLYVNGALADSKTNVGVTIVYPTFGGQRVTLGGSGDIGRTFGGRMAEVQISTVPQSPSDLALTPWKRKDDALLAYLATQDLAGLDTSLN